MAIPERGPGALSTEAPGPRRNTSCASLGFARAARPNVVLDLVLFGGELDLLEVRLHEVAAAVDLVVLVEVRALRVDLGRVPSSTSAATESELQSLWHSASPDSNA